MNLYHDILNGIDKCNEHIHQTITVSEQDFLTLGSKLATCNQYSQSVTRQSSAIAGAFAGDEVRQSLNDLNIALTAITDRISSTEDFLNTEMGNLREISHLISEAVDILTGFKRLIKRLRIFSISTRIESERLGDSGAGFHVISQLIDDLADDVRDKFDAIRISSGKLTGIITQTMQQIVALDQKRKAESGNLAGEIDRDISFLSDKYQQAGSELTSLSELSGSISKSMSDIVASLQFHDITRQQLEHILAALQDCVSIADTVFASEDYLSDTENHRKAGEIYHLILIQNAQVQNSQDELLRAIDTITSGLTAVQESTISEVRRLKIFAEGAGSRNKENQLNRLTDSFLKIPEMLGKVNLITDELKTSVQSVLPLVNELLLFSEQIDKISAEIKLIALNASVKAARAGIEGRGLGVLADAIQELSVDAEGIIHSIMSILEKVKEKTTSHASLLNENDGSESLRTITEQITANVGYFRTMDQNVLSGLEQMNKSVQELDTQIANALKSLHLQTVVSSSLSAASSHLSNIAGIIEAEFNLEHVTAADLKRLRDNYSMEREREIHDSILFDTDAPVSEGYQHNDTGSGEYGDNVELF